ncbi:MAG: zinc ribbon domain-containing protein [Clostridiales bacterium]|nr:zinc ribbon domain-containing protein [Clostridiales bacterium]MCD8110475.1 zinc ribbon domain-containing protein [Clostridiales bacterium]
MAGMDFFNKLGSSISSAGKDGLNKAKEMKDSAKISLDIKERENSIQKMYRELGKAYYQDHKDDISSEYSDRIASIKAAFEEIGELKSNLDDVRGIRRCPHCGKVVSPEAKFCASCGEKCEEEIVECEVVGDEAGAEEGTVDDIVAEAEEGTDDDIVAEAETADRTASEDLES